MIPNWFQRLFWGRTRENSAALAIAEWRARRKRLLAEALQSDGCIVVHAPEIWAGYCEVHEYPVDRGDHCTRGTHAHPTLAFKNYNPDKWTITSLAPEGDDGGKRS